MKYMEIQAGGSTGIFMDIHAYTGPPWVSIDIHGGIHGYQWISQGCPWIYMELNGYPSKQWIYMDLHDFYGYSSPSMGIHRIHG